MKKMKNSMKCHRHDIMDYHAILKNDIPGDIVNAQKKVCYTNAIAYPFSKDVL